MSPALFPAKKARIEIVTMAIIVHGNGCDDIDCGNARQIIDATATMGSDTSIRSLNNHKSSQLFPVP
jgi:hypothetical protein